METEMDYDDFVFAFCDDASDPRPTSLEGRILHYLSSAGVTGFSARVLFNRMRAVSKDQREDIMKSLHKLHQDGRIEAVQTGRLYAGKQVTSFVLKNKP